MKKIVSVVAAALMLTSVVCAKAAKKTAVKVGVAMPTKSLQRWNQDGSNMKKELEKAGYKVDAYIHGIGENKAIRDLYVKRAEDAWNELEK